MLSAGENPMWVAQQMGHRDWGMIRKTYGRWISAVDPTAGNKGTLAWSRFGHDGKASA
jgi:integrase